MYGEATGRQEKDLCPETEENRQTGSERAALASAAASLPAPLPKDENDGLVCPVAWLLGGGSARIFSWRGRMEEEGRGGWECFGAGPRLPPAPLPMEISAPGDGDGGSLLFTHRTHELTASFPFSRNTSRRRSGWLLFISGRG
ncbi:hypothetical protein CSHISOI_06141 [Colletotrichum shisoi]|uniref:Uncharacterized protein n=1 Tax=Colletotrichum shisoi TaxID=2078593 RepID=A0A5Q4BLT7_9PEZI|nr:hypothetical protein CSHISOI_06141 [Colletotrichum shisoi]